jgi:UDP-3-O-[3-hydroxymyristoyl] glucosamine N-acyltransferase
VKLAELAAALGLPFEGDGALALDGLASLEDAGARDVAFVTGPKYKAAFAASRAGAFILPPDFDAQGRACLRSRAAYADFARAVDLLRPRPAAAPGVHPSAAVAPDAVLGPGTSVGPYAVIGAGARLGARVRIHPHATVYPGVEIGDDTEVHSHASLREGTRLGKRVVVQNGAVIGAPGFGFATGADGKRVRVPHACPVEIGDDCEIGANTTIDASHPAHPRRGYPDVRTRLGADVKVDNQVHIAHGCEIAEHTTVCAQVGLAGSTIVGHHVYLAGRSASAGHLTIGDGAMVGAQTAAAGDVAPGAQVLGIPAIERRLWGKVAAAWKRLPDLFHRVRRIEKKLGIERGEE